jgi:hypothetical protein
VRPDRLHRIPWWTVAILLAAVLLYRPLRKVAWDRIWHARECPADAKARLDPLYGVLRQHGSVSGNDILPARAGEMLRSVLPLPFRLTLLLARLALGVPSTPWDVGIYQFVAVTILMPFGMRLDGVIAGILASRICSLC